MIIENTRTSDESQKNVPTLDIQALQSVLIFAPHPADGTLGCSGLIAQLINAGQRVDVAVVVNASNRSEIQKTLMDLGIEARHIHQLELPSEASLGDSPVISELAARFTALITLCRPQTLLVPDSGDDQPAHHNVTEAAYAAVAFPAPPLRILEYPQANGTGHVPVTSDTRAMLQLPDGRDISRLAADSTGPEMYYERPRRSKPPGVFNDRT